MLNDLQLWNLGSGTSPEGQTHENSFILKTCQRTLVLSFEPHSFECASELHQGQAAYLFLLETICGLKSKLIGENEIVGQFKDAYKAYAQLETKDTRILMIIEKLFKDAKDIRTQYLIGISQKTYASLTRKHLIQKAHADHVLILGSGMLAEDLINQFKKKARVSICARNSERVQELARIHQLTVIPWENRHDLVNQPFIANTIGHESILLDETFFQEWTNRNPLRLFVDLGSPSVIKTSLTLAEGVVRLENIFDEGAIVETQKQQQIALAREAMQIITHRRKTLFEAKLTRPTVLTPQSA